MRGRPANGFGRACPEFAEGLTPQADPEHLQAAVFAKLHRAEEGLLNNASHTAMGAHLQRPLCFIKSSSYGVGFDNGTP